MMGNDLGKRAIDTLYDALSRSTDDYVYVGDLRTGTFRYPKQMVEEFGLPGEIMENAADFWSNLIHEKDREAFLKANRDVAEGKSRSHNVEYRAKNVEGKWIWLHCRGHAEPDEQGNFTFFAGMITNLSRYVRTDHVTGLLNRFEAEKNINRIILAAPKQTVGILVLGFDDFRRINDLYDRAMGDEVLRETALLLQSLLPECARLYRFDGDEYAVLFRDVAREEVFVFYHDLQELLAGPKECNGRRYTASLSGGYASYPRDGADYQELVKRAVYSLEYSKQTGKNRLTFCSEEVMAGRKRSLELTETLRRSIENGFQGFEMHYQPLYCVGEGRINGAEALARFSCERFGRISPLEFIPLLEKSELIHKAGIWIFETAVSAAKKFAERIPDFSMHINVSWAQFEKEDFLRYLIQKQQEGLWKGCHIVIELTETCISSNYEQVKEILHALHELGFRVAMDDFGTGYSSLGLLKAVPVNIVKIDQSFISNMRESIFDDTFIEFIVKLCHTMGITVCQEGVELPEQADELRDKQLDIYQGYYFGKPMPETEFEKLCDRSGKN